MTGYEFRPDDYQLADTIFRHCIEDNLAEEDNLSTIKKSFMAEAGKAWQEGSFTVVVERLVVDHFWQRVNNRAGAATGRFLRDVASGQAVVGYDVWLDTPITAGKHRRTTIRNYNMVDNERVLAERAENLEQQRKAYEEAEKAAKILRLGLSDYHDISSWMKSAKAIQFPRSNPENVQVAGAAESAA